MSNKEHKTQTQHHGHGEGHDHGDHHHCDHSGPHHHHEPHDRYTRAIIGPLEIEQLSDTSIEQLQDISRASGCSLHDAVSAVAGKAGANLGAFVARLDVMREQTAGLTLREIIELVLQQSGLEEHYKLEKEGQDRLENLGELVNAAESFVGQEGFVHASVHARPVARQPGP